MGLLGDLFSEIDRKKRQLRGLLSDPVETLYQGVRNFGAEQQGLLDTQARAYPWTGATPDAKPDARARKELADAGAAQGMAAATVWHGSPHKFDKFDSSKIGTGEGAQAYGHGLYLAEDRGIADVYRKKLTGVDGAPVGNPNDSLQLKIGRLQFEIDRLRKSGDSSAPAMIRAYESRIKELDGAGSLYKVDLPDEHIAKMLDWDKPLSQQAPEVQAVLGRQLKEYQKSAGVSDRYMDAEFGGKDAAQIYQQLASKYGSAGASGVLRQQGIPGIRYLDGGSRGAGTGTSNYVVFPGNEDILKILERNGQGLLGQ